MKKVSTLPILQFAGRGGNGPIAIHGEPTAALRHTDTESLDLEAIDSWVEMARQFQAKMRKAAPFLGCIVAASCPFMPDAGLVQAATSIGLQCSPSLVERDLTRALDIDEAQVIAIAQCASKGQVVLTGSLPDRVRLPMHSVRPACWENVEEPEWDPLGYEVGQAIDKYFERADADSETPQE